MAKKIPTKSLHKREFQDYWKKAQDFFLGMNQAYLNNNWNSTALEGVHAAISAADAILIFSRGYKSASQRHSDVSTLVENLSLDGSKQAAEHLSKILSVKSLVEYSGDNYMADEAYEILKQVERFFNWCRKILPHH